MKGKQTQIFAHEILIGVHFPIHFPGRIQNHRVQRETGVVLKSRIRRKQQLLILIAVADVIVFRDDHRPVGKTAGGCIQKVGYRVFRRALLAGD